MTMNRRIAGVACAAALTVIAAGTASAAPAPAPDSAPVGAMQWPTPGQTYVLAPQNAPDQWLGDADYFGQVVCKASRLWYGGQHDNAVWQVTGNNDGTISLVNMDAEQNRQSLASAGDAIRIDEGHGDEFNWIVTAGPSGTVALKNKRTNKFLTLAAAGVVGAAQTFHWYMVNQRP